MSTDMRSCTRWERKREVIKKQTRTLSLASHLFICWLSLTLLPASNDRILCLFVVLMHSVQLFPLSSQHVCTHTKPCVFTRKSVSKQFQKRLSEKLPLCAILSWLQIKAAGTFYSFQINFCGRWKKAQMFWSRINRSQMKLLLLWKGKQPLSYSPRSSRFLFTVSQVTSNRTQSEKQAIDAAT